MTFYSFMELSMILSDSDYNAFASTLVRRVAERAKGIDSENARIIGARPADRILAGFLTPADLTPLDQSRQRPAEEPEDFLADDLPKDSAYEQSAVGIEWISPLSALD